MPRAKTLEAITKYCSTSSGYDELYREEQFTKYSIVLKKCPSGKLLDAGAGTCLLLEFLYAKGCLHAILLNYILVMDVTECMLCLCKDKILKLSLGHLVDVVVADVENPPFRKGSTDFVFSFTVLDLTDNPCKAALELANVASSCVITTVLRRETLSKILDMCAEVLDAGKDFVCIIRGCRQEPP